MHQQEQKHSHSPPEEFYFLCAQLTQDEPPVCQQVVEHYHHVFVDVL